MTWVIGIRAVGFVTLIGDLRVSVVRGSQLYPIERCGIRKLGHVSDHVLAGFAGHVDRSFRYMKDLAMFLAGRNGSGHLFHEVEAWIDDLKNRGSSLVESGEDVQLLALAVSPTEDFGPPDLATGIPKTEGVRITAPSAQSDFRIDEIPPMSGASVGSGADVPAYLEALQAATKREDLVRLANFHQAAPGGAAGGIVLAHVLRQAFLKELEPTVGPHILFGVLNRSGASFYDSVSPESTFRVTSSPAELVSCLESEGPAGSLGALVG